MDYYKILEEKLKNVFFRERYIKDIDNFINSNLIQVVVWQRRVGKSYYIFQVIKKLIEKEIIKLTDVFYVNKEWFLFDNVNTYKDLQDFFIKWYNSKKKRDLILVCLDEIQEIENWEKFVLGVWSMYDNVRIIVSGSNSKLLSYDISTKLRWRYIVKTIYPLSFKEFLKFYWFRKNEKNFLKYLYWWGLPELKNISTNESKLNYLKTLYETIFVKDIVEYFNIRYPKFLKQIHKFLFSEIWNLISVKNIYWYLKNLGFKISLETIYNYIDYTLSSFLFYEVNRYDLRWKKILEWISKFYVNDLWIRTSIIWYSAEDIGKVLENIVFLHLKIKWYQVYIWKYQDKEIDFIAEKNGDRIYIQVTYMLISEKVVEREVWNLLKIRDWWPKVVLSMDKLYKWRIKGVEIMNIIDWLYNF